MVFGQPPGNVTLDMVRKAKQLGYVIGSASDRAVGNQIQLWEQANIEVDFTIQKHNLTIIRKRFEVAHYLHVGDTEMDKHFAHLAGFDFLLIDHVPSDGSHGWLVETAAMQKPGSKPQEQSAGPGNNDIAMVKRPDLMFVGLELSAASERDSLDLIPVAWQWVYQHQHEILHRYGNTFADLTLGWRDGHFKRLIGAEVTKVDVLPHGMSVVKIPSRRYLFYRHPGSNKGVRDSFGFMYNWGRHAGYTSDSLRMDIGYLPTDDEAYHDLLMRLEDVPMREPWDPFEYGMAGRGGP